jgi:hypothetical protein
MISWSAIPNPAEKWNRTQVRLLGVTAYYDDRPFDDGNHVAHGVDLAISTKEVRKRYIKLGIVKFARSGGEQLIRSLSSSGSRSMTTQ